MTLRAHVMVTLAGFDLAVELDAPAGAVTAVLGPSGAGKTTLLRCIAGTLPIDSGAISLDERVLDRPPDRFVLPENRHLGIVHQDYLLFPHMSVLDNVEFGLRGRGRDRGESRAIAGRWLERVGVGDCARAKPRTLSGGQAQRVALARALATEPEALLLDEPLSALDAGNRTEVRRDLHRYLGDYSGVTILVTHDPVDALALADRVAILEKGRFTQTGTIAEVTTRPRSRYVADLIGTNLIRGVAERTTITTSTGTVIATAEEHAGPVFACIAPTAVAIHQREPEGSPRNNWHTRIVHLDILGDRTRVHLASPPGLVAEITSAAAAQLHLREGDAAWATVKATEVSTYPD